MKFIHGTILFIMPLYLLAQAPKMKQFTSEDGLPSSHVYRAVQDKEGFIWLCTDKGLARFDGYTFDVFTVKNGLPSNDVWHLSEDYKGRLWLSTYDQVTYFEDGTFYTLPNPQGALISGLINYDINQDDTSLYFTAEPGPSLYQILSNNQIQLRKPKIEGAVRFKEEKKNSFSYIGKDRNQQSWYRAFTEKDGSIMILLKEERGRHKIEHTIRNDQFNRNSQLLNFGDKVVFYSKNNFYLFDFQQILKRSITSVFEEDLIVLNISRMGRDKILVRTNKENKVIDTNLNPLEEFDFLTNMSINSIFEDAAKNLWICTPSGLFFLSEDGQRSRSYLFAEDKLGNEVTALALDKTGETFIGTASGTIYQFDEQGNVNNINLNLSSPSSHPTILELLPRSNGDLIIGSNIGIAIANREELIKGQVDRRLQNQPLHAFNTNLYDYEYYLPLSLKAICSENDDYFLVAYSHGINVLSNTGYHKLPFYQKDKHWKRIYSIAIDKQDTLWVGRKSGLFFLPKFKLLEEGERKSSFTKPINDIKIRNGNEKWVATDGFGLYKVSDNDFHIIPETKNDIISSLFIDDDNDIWLATNKGVRKVSILQDYPLSYTIQHYSIAQGLSSNEVNKVLVADGKVYIATQNGLTILDEKEKNTLEVSPQLLLRNIIINGQDTVHNNSLKLKYYQNNIKLDYVCLSYKSMGNINYYYQMKGLDTTWRSTSSLELFFPFLPTGVYEFNLQGEDIDGFKSNIISIDFIISPPWWERQGVRFITFLLLVSGITIGIQRRIKQIKRKAEEQNRIEKKFAELELQALQAQMNPHFVFNSLQAIQDFIFNKDELLANQYLVKFSRLMRLFLESSKEKYILLKDEIQLITLYVELEKIRFEDKFDYTIHVDSDIVTDLLEIPSMLIQPFIENAINHGLLHKATKGQLTIQISRKDDYMICEIKDNGIGRKKAREIKQKSYKSYRSRGMDLVQERQNIINFIEDSNMEIQINDLSNSTGEALGTDVRITIPIN